MTSQIMYISIYASVAEQNDTTFLLKHTQTGLCVSNAVLQRALCEHMVLKFSP